MTVVVLTLEALRGRGYRLSHARRRDSRLPTLDPFRGTNCLVSPPPSLSSHPFFDLVAPLDEPLRSISLTDPAFLPRLGTATMSFDKGEQPVKNAELTLALLPVVAILGPVTP